MSVVATTDGHVGIVTLTGAPHNFVSSSIITELAERVKAFDADPLIRAIVLQSEGKSFCAGADLNQQRSADERRTEMTALYGAGGRLFDCETPIIAAVQGPAVGAGLGLALVADFRIAAPEARFVANFVKLAFHPGFAITSTLPELIGKQRAAIMLLTGRRIDGAEALRWGLVDEVHPLVELASRTLAFAREIAENAPLALRDTRRTLRMGMATRVVDRLAHELEHQIALMETEDFREGVRAVIERRPGNFVGR
ncbi:enoyl-CoA hydratase/isomerase family protein [Sphingobium sp. JS3065]|uniref:enoyl-CoA hydratase/isomerase family protein n=1 Tax=Sphingobium sp. JS3065 TaxID=2970925 RepID=UPI0022649537|nr:enoyl-CoA hydratase/isomerase family protein [Sphingobium sp. JS3065]UZW53824.1 enoyl-CoA hydratase/isomerase family protein [Sphingobium sp. JS3065]